MTIRHEYSISGWVHIDGHLVIRRVGMTELVAEYARLNATIPPSLASLNERGERYSYESFDTLGAAMSELYRNDRNIWQRIGRAEKTS